MESTSSPQHHNSTFELYYEELKKLEHNVKKDFHDLLYVPEDHMKISSSDSTQNINESFQSKNFPKELLYIKDIIQIYEAPKYVLKHEQTPYTKFQYEDDKFKDKKFKFAIDRKKTSEQSGENNFAEMAKENEEKTAPKSKLTADILDFSLSETRKKISKLES